MVRVAVILALLLASGCSGRSEKGGEASGGQSGNGGGSSGGSSAGGTSGTSNGGTSGSSSGGSSSGGTTAQGGSSGSSPMTGGSSPTGGASPTGGGAGSAGMETGGTGAAGEGGAAGAAGASACEEPSPGGCPARRCSDGQSCQALSGRCVPSRCDCVNGEWACTRDCGGGVCVDTPSCTTPDPSGCATNDDCASGEVCTQPAITVCIPTGCVCTLAGTWQCQNECNGGVCMPPSCPMGCEAQPSAFCGDDRVTWVCTGGAIPWQEFMDAGCTDPGTQVPRYCCPTTYKPECQ